MDSQAHINALILDLSRQESRPLQFDAELLGGLDLGLHLLAHLRADDPAAVVLATGRFSGTVAPSGSVVGAFAVAGGAVVEDYFPGSFGAQMLRAGWDAVALVGTTERPTHVVVDDDAATFHRAELLTNQPMPQARDRLLELAGDPAAATLVTGPAADHGLAGAQVCGDVMGRGNMGALWSAKRLKAVAMRGSGDVRVPDARKLLDAVRALKVQQTKLPGGFEKAASGLRACLQCRHPCRASFQLDGATYTFTFRELTAFTCGAQETLAVLKVCYDWGVSPLACAKLAGREKAPAAKLARLLEEDGPQEPVPPLSAGTRLFDALVTCRELPIGEQQLLELYPLVTGQKLERTQVQALEKRVEHAAKQLARPAAAATQTGART